MRTIVYSFLSNSLATFKWQWKITPQSLLSGPDNTGLKMVRVMHVRMKFMHVRMRVMHIMSTSQTKTLSTVSQGVGDIFEITTISKPAKLCLFLIYLVSCCQKQCSLFPHSSDNIKWLKKEAQQVTTWNNWEGEVIPLVLGWEREQVQLWRLFWNDVKWMGGAKNCRDKGWHPQGRSYIGLLAELSLQEQNLLWSIAYELCHLGFRQRCLVQWKYHASRYCISFWNWNQTMGLLIIKIFLMWAT